MNTSKKDIFNHARNYNRWKEDLTEEYVEDKLTKENSKLFLQYLSDMEQGLNVSMKNKKGARDTKTLNRLRGKVKSILIMLQDAGIKDISKATEKQVVEFFSNWKKNHSSDYAKRFKALWHWYMKVNRKKGVVILDITEEIDTSGDKTKFVWITKEDFDNYRKFFSEDEQLILLFCFDSIIRSPTELLSLKVENIFQNSKREVWVDIPDEISKTFGRKFNLLYCGEQMLKYTEGRKAEEDLFQINHLTLTDKMQRIAKQVFAEKKSLGGEYYKNITLYDLRHSGAIHFRQLFAKTGQSLDILRHRGGWTDFDMINEYTRLLGLDGYVEKEKLLLEEDKTKIQKEFEAYKIQAKKEVAEMRSYINQKILEIEQRVKR